MRKLVAPLVTMAAVFAATLSPLHGQSAPPDLPKGYLISATYAGGKVEAMSFDSIETKNVYSGRIQNAAGKSYTFASKLVTAVLCLDTEVHDQVNAQLAGSNGTFLRAKVQLADIQGAKSSTEQLLAQKKELETLMETTQLQSALSRVVTALDAAIAQSREAAPAPEAPAARAGSPTTTTTTAAAAAAASAGFSFTTVSGKKFTNAQVGGVSEEGVGLITESGVDRVPLKDIPEGAPGFPEEARNQIVALQTAAAEKEAAEKAAAEKAAAEQAAAEEAAAQKAAEKAEKERLAAEKAAERKAASEKAAAERAAKKAATDAAKKPKEE